jgi:DNA-binding MarR family transcriptional regulator
MDWPTSPPGARGPVRRRESIGIDDANASANAGPVISSDCTGEPVAAQAEAFEQRFQAVYLAFHRRDGKRSQLSGASRAVLTHLAMSGPLTVGEAAVHLDRAQSAVSDVVTQLEGKGLLEREPDPSDRRRTLVWLTPAGQARLAEDRRVLAVPRLEQALRRLPPDHRAGLLAALEELVAAAPRPDIDDQETT